MGAEYVAANTLRLSFNDDTWETAFPDIYSIEQADKSWYRSDDIPYDEADTLRSAEIVYGEDSSFTLHVELAQAGGVQGIIQGAAAPGYGFTIETNEEPPQTLVFEEVINSWTLFNIQLVAGTHEIIFTYSKDVLEEPDEDEPPDLWAIGYIDLIGVKPEYTSYFIISNDETNVFYALQNNSLVVVPIAGTEPTIEEYREYGGAKPSLVQTSTLKKWSLYVCHDIGTHAEARDKLVGYRYDMIGAPSPRLYQIGQNFKPDQSYQTGFAAITADVTTGVSTRLYWVLSPEANVWKAYNGTAWVDVNFTVEDVLLNGMSTTVLNALTAEQITSIHEPGDEQYLKIGFAIHSASTDEWRMRSVQVQYTTDL